MTKKYTVKPCWLYCIIARQESRPYFSKNRDTPTPKKTRFYFLNNRDKKERICYSKNRDKREHLYRPRWILGFSYDKKVPNGNTPNIHWRKRFIVSLQLSLVFCFQNSLSRIPPKKKKRKMAADKINVRHCQLFFFFQIEQDIS